jgi:hypothetical protein
LRTAHIDRPSSQSNLHPSTTRTGRSDTGFGEFRVVRGPHRIDAAAIGARKFAMGDTRGRGDGFIRRDQRAALPLMKIVEVFQGRRSCAGKRERICLSGGRMLACSLRAIPVSTTARPSCRLQSPTRQARPNGHGRVPATSVYQGSSGNGRPLRSIRSSRSRTACASSGMSTQSRTSRRWTIRHSPSRFSIWSR